MLLLDLFFTFFKIGLFTIGGGYAMIPMIEDEVISKAWITSNDLTNFLALSESTPGPFAVNVATFIGYNKAGFLGALLTTFGLVLPSFIIIVIISNVIFKMLKNRHVDNAMKGVRPVVVGLILSVVINLFIQAVFGGSIQFKNISFSSIIIFTIAFVMTRFKKTSSPILLILVSAVLGIVFFGLCKGF